MMYIKQTRTYYDAHGQHTTREFFLLLIEPEGWDPHQEYAFKALVRKVALHQCGHFMMGLARVYGQTIMVSGSYGGDGLPCRVPKEIYERAPVTLPQELYELWAKGGGWNSAGSETEEMRKWARKNLKELRK